MCCSSAILVMLLFHALSNDSVSAVYAIVSNDKRRCADLESVWTSNRNITVPDDA